MAVRGMDSSPTLSILSTAMIILVTSQLAKSKPLVCDPLVSKTVDISCQLGDASVNCTKSVPSGTIARVTCKRGHRMEDVDIDYNTTKCVFGSWEKELFSCAPPREEEGDNLINADICGQTVTNPAYNPRGFDLDEFNKTHPEMFQMPWMALLVYRTKLDRLKYYCSGSVINERYVLTSARCVTLKSSDTLEAVRLGVHDSNSTFDCITPGGGTETCANISRIIPHPEYNQCTLENDIALLRLESDIDFSMDSVKPICLPVGKSETSRVFTNEKMSVAGWGLTNKVNSTNLYKRDQKIVSNSECIRSHPPTRGVRLAVTKKQMCYGLAEDSCHGDNGGPIVTNGLEDLETKTVQYGIRSYHPGCNYSTVPSVATKVGAYMQWILSVISAKEVSSPI